MMNALPQSMPSQSGIAALLAGTGGGVPNGGGGFDALFADLPALDGVKPVAQPFRDAIAIALPAPAADGDATNADAAPTDAATPATDAAVAAALLIRIASGEGEAKAPPSATPVGPVAVAPDSDEEANGDPADSLDPDAAAPDAPLLAVALPVASEPVKRDDAPDRAPAEPAVTPRAPKADTAPLADIAGGPAPKAPKTVDTGASMTVLFAQATTAQAAAAPAPAAAAAPVAERVLDMGSDDAWIAQLAADIAATKSHDGDISFRLMPRHLGRLDVAMTSGDNGVSLKLDTQHEATATVVHAAQGKLVEDLRQQGVRVTGAEVTCTPGETGRQSQGQSQGRDASGAAHLIETATERADAAARRDDEPRAERHGRFA